jgi:hypothetical protein
LRAVFWLTTDERKPQPQFIVKRPGLPATVSTGTVATKPKEFNMKYALITLAALTLWTGSASAQDKTWPCIDLHANWQNAPKKQCHQLFIEGEQKTFQPKVQEVPVMEEDRNT